MANGPSNEQLTNACHSGMYHGSLVDWIPQWCRECRAMKYVIAFYDDVNAEERFAEYHMTSTAIADALRYAADILPTLQGNAHVESVVVEIDDDDPSC